VDAYRGDGKRFIVHADELLTAFLKLEAAISAISRHASPRGGFSFQARDAQHSLKSPACSNVSITLPASS
jgi:hypothetical protein